MRFQRYADTDSFAADTLDILLENEAQNNLLISLIGNKTDAVRHWLLSAVFDDDGRVVLTAACTPPFNIVLYETGNRPNGRALRLLSGELERIGFQVPGVMAEQTLARRFAEIHAGDGFHRQLSMNIMRLDAVADAGNVPGSCRPLREEDLFFAPYWERAFGEDCRIEVYSVADNARRQKERLGRDVHYIWEDGVPVSQAVHVRSTKNGAIVGGVYTPPHYRGRGYAKTLVAALSQILLERGNKFCALSADAANPVSCGIYRKIGYRDLCVFDVLTFRESAAA